MRDERPPGWEHTTRDGGRDEQTYRQGRAQAAGCQRRENACAGGQSQPEPDPDVRSRGTWALVFQPHPHPRLPDGVDDSGRCELCGVI